MNEPKRLRDQDSDRVARLLLDAGHFDDPPKKRLDRIVAGVVGAGAAAGAKTAIAGSALAAAPIAAKSVTPLALALKWLGVGVVAGLAVSGGAASLQTDDVATESDHGTSLPLAKRRDPEGTRESPRSFEPAPEERVDPPIAAASTTDLDVARRVQSHPLPTSAARAGSTAVQNRAERPSSNRASGAEPAAEMVARTEPEANAQLAETPLEPGSSHALREELAALSFAKSALNQGSARVALSAMHSYRKRFPHGALGREATYIEMEAEHALGNRSRAVELAAVLAPGVTPNAERAREILKGE